MAGPSPEKVVGIIPLVTRRMRAFELIFTDRRMIASEVRDLTSGATGRWFWWGIGNAKALERAASERLAGRDPDEALRESPKNFALEYQTIAWAEQRGPMIRLRVRKSTVSFRITQLPRSSLGSERHRPRNDDLAAQAWSVLASALGAKARIR